MGGSFQQARSLQWSAVQRPDQMGAGAAALAAAGQQAGQYVLCHQCGARFPPDPATAAERCIRCGGDFIERIESVVMPINESRALITLLSSGASPTDLLLHVAALNQGGETVAQREERQYQQAVTESMDQQRADNPVPATVRDKLQKGPAQENAPECPICCSEQEVGQSLLFLRCGHQYHEQCIATWMDSQNYCPVCRATIVVGSSANLVDGTQVNSYTNVLEEGTNGE